MLKNIKKYSKFIRSLMVCSTVLGVVEPSITNVAHASTSKNTTPTVAQPNKSNVNATTNNQNKNYQKSTNANNNKQVNQNNKNTNFAQQNNSQKNTKKNNVLNISGIEDQNKSNQKSNTTNINAKNNKKMNNVVGHSDNNQVIHHDVNNVNKPKNQNSNHTQNVIKPKLNITKKTVNKYSNNSSKNKNNKNTQNTRLNFKTINDKNNKPRLKKNVAKNTQKKVKGVNATKVIDGNIQKSIKKPYQQTKAQQQKQHYISDQAKIQNYQHKINVIREHFEKGIARTPKEMLPNTKRESTPLPSSQYTEHRTHVVNPMFRTNTEYHTMHQEITSNGGHFKNSVPMTKTTMPSRDLKNVKPFKGFDKSVLRYKPYLDKVCQHYGMQKYEILFLAIMENETKGNSKDVMQSSESAGLSPNTLNAQQSIEQAVVYMKGIVNKAHKMDLRERADKSMKPQDYHDYATDNELLAQTYNYGAGFLDYVSHSKNGYNVNVAQKYSKDVVAPRLGNSSGKTYTYDNPIAKMYKKNFLYTNGGNYLYGALVEQYMTNGTLLQPILQNLVQYSGQKYVFGGKEPKHGFDCSGIVSYGLKKAYGMNFPSYTVSQWHDTKPVQSLNASKPGDLIFFKGTYGSKNFISHVEMVVDRDTMFGSDGSGVGFHDIRQPYWNHHFAGVRRLNQAPKLNKQASRQLNHQVQQATK